MNKFNAKNAQKTIKDNLVESFSGLSPQEFKEATMAVYLYPDDDAIDFGATGVETGAGAR